MNKSQKEIEELVEEFRGRFELENQGCSECGGFELVDMEETRYPKGEYHCEYDLEKVYDWLRKALTKAYEKGYAEGYTQRFEDDKAKLATRIDEKLSELQNKH